MTHAPGTITVTYHHTPNGPIPRPLIIWDTAVDGDDSRWLVQWATTELDAAATDGYHEPNKPTGPGFILHHLGTNGQNWESETTPDVGAFGPAGIVEVAQYEANDPAYNGVEIMAQMALEQVTDGPDVTIIRHGETLIAAREHEERVTDHLRAAVHAGAEAGIPEARMAAMGRVTRMTIRSWLGK